MKSKILITILITMFSFVITIPTMAYTDTVFSDISTENKYYDATYFLQKNGIINGHSDGTFKPNNTINRAEFTKILIETIKNDDEIAGNNCFSDVTGNWYAKYVCTAKETGLIKGYNNNTFKPTRNITFVEAAKIITVAMYKTTEDPTVWYKNYVSKLSNNFAIPTSIHDLNKDITRGEMSEIIYRLKNDIVNKDFAQFKEDKLEIGVFEDLTDYDDSDHSSDDIMCTLNMETGLVVHVYNDTGFRIMNAQVTATNNAGSNTLIEGATSYTGLMEGEGEYFLEIEKEGYQGHAEYITLEHDECHVITEYIEVTLLSDDTEGVVLYDDFDSRFTEYEYEILTTTNEAEGLSFLFDEEFYAENPLPMVAVKRENVKVIVPEGYEELAKAHVEDLITCQPLLSDFWGGKDFPEDELLLKIYISSDDKNRGFSWGPYLFYKRSQENIDMALSDVVTNNSDGFLYNSGPDHCTNSHELTHAFFTNAPLPSWANEGLAQYTQKHNQGDVFSWVECNETGYYKFDEWFDYADLTSDEALDYNTAMCFIEELDLTYGHDVFEDFIARLGMVQSGEIARITNTSYSLVEDVLKVIYGDEVIEILEKYGIEPVDYVF